MAKLNYKEVIEFFDEISTDMADLVLGIIKDKLEAKEALRAKRSNVLKKARAAKDGGQQTGQQAAGQPVQATRRPGRPPRVDNRQADNLNDQLTSAAGQ